MLLFTGKIIKMKAGSLKCKKKNVIIYCSFEIRIIDVPT